MLAVELVTRRVKNGLLMSRLSPRTKPDTSPSLDAVTAAWAPSLNTAYEVTLVHVSEGESCTLLVAVHLIPREMGLMASSAEYWRNLCTLMST